MKALITGGTGFFGANLVKGLTEKGYEARILKRQTSQMEALESLEFEQSTGDILDEKSLINAMEGCDWVFHCAAVSDYWRQGIGWLYKVNVEGTRTVLRAAQKAGIKRLVYTSSVAALGVSTGEQLMDETNTFNISPRRFPYGHSKHLAEQQVQQAVREGLDGVIVNPAVVIGPRDINKVSGSLVIEVARGLVRFYLPGGVNYVAVEDVISGHISAAERGRTGERYILGGHNLTHRQAIDVILQVTGGPTPLFTVPLWAIEPIAVGVTAARKIFGNRIPINSNQVRMSGQKLFFKTLKAERELELPKTSFQTAVERAYLWFKDNGYL